MNQNDDVEIQNDLLKITPQRDIDDLTPEKALETNNSKSKFFSTARENKAIIALLFVWIALAFYGETEGQWFNNFVTNDIIGTGYSDTQMGYMVSTSAIMGTVAFIFWAIVSDNIRTKYGRRVPIYIGGALLTALFVILFGRSTNLTWLIICDGVIIGFTSNMFHCSSRAMIPDIFEKNKRGRVNFFMQIGSAIGAVSIWGIAFLFKAKNGEGGTFNRSQFDTIFTICAVLLCLSAIVVFLLIKEPKANSPPRKFSEDFKLMFDGKEMSKHKNFLKLFIGNMFVIMSANAYRPWMLSMLDETTFPSELWKLIIAGTIVAGIAIPIIVKSGSIVDKLGRKKGVFLGLIFVPLGYLIMAFSNYNFYAIAIGLAILLSFTIGMDIAIQTWTQDLLPAESRAKFLGIINIGKAAGQVPGVLIAGIVSDNFGTLAIFLVSLVYLLIAIPIFLRVPETLNK